MPRLLLFAPCEKLIVDQDGNPSLLVVIQNINIEVPRGQAFPSDVMAPQAWDVITLWYPEAGDKGKTFHQRIEFEQPEGSVPIRGQSTFTFGETTHRLKLHVGGFPVGRKGTCWLKLWLDADGEIPSVDPIAAYPIIVNHVEQIPPVTASTI